MKIKKQYREPYSTILRRNIDEDKTEIVNTMQWVALIALFLFLTLIFSYMLSGFYKNALFAAIGIIPILLSIVLLKKESVSIPSIILSITLIVEVTLQATYGQGLYDIGVLGFPAVLIVAGLILRGRAIMYLTYLVIGCVGWLSLGEYYGAYQPLPISLFNIHDLPIAIIITLVVGNSVYRLSRNVDYNLANAKQEIENRKRAEIERELSILQLRSKNQELDRFAIRVSHDLKSPLITLAGFLGLLEKDLHAKEQERVEKDLAQINEAAKTMGKFVDELLDLSRVGRIINPPKDVAFDVIVEEALKTTDGLLKSKQVQVEVDAFFPFVHVDLPRVVQILQNLIVNAVKFMGDQPHPAIRLGFKEIEGEHIFYVRDNGIGIAPEHHEDIFELFSKLNPEIEGTGLGLGLVKKIIEVHHGRIWVESELGKGSTFKFTLGHAPQTHE